MSSHLAVTSAGLIADARMWVDRARTEAQNYWFTYNRKMRVEDVTQTVANLALHFGDDDSKVIKVLYNILFYTLFVVDNTWTAFWSCNAFCRC